jgi:hypothetical protein
MNREEAISILDALAEGCSPFTGEMLHDHSLLNERKVIRALQVAMDALAYNTAAPANDTVKLSDRYKAEVKNKTTPLEKQTVVDALNVLFKAGIKPTHSKLTKFFLGSRQFPIGPVRQSRLYGSLSSRHTYTSLLAEVLSFLNAHPGLLEAFKPAERSKPWDSVTYFHQKQFCNLSARAFDQLKEKIAELGIVKQPPILSDYIINSRIVYPRAYEPWSDKELEYLAKALYYTNDLQVLTTCFQRGERSIENVGKKLIYDGKAIIPEQN